MEIGLEEDDPEAMELILRVVHHKMEGVELDLPLKTLAFVAIQADKYDCVGALKLCIDRWARTIKALANSKDADTLGDSLVAAHLLRLSSFRAMVTSVLQTQSFDALSKMRQHKMVGFLPTGVTGQFPLLK